MNALLELRKQMEVNFLKTKTYEEINDMFSQLNDKLKLAESEVKNFRLGAVFQNCTNLNKTDMLERLINSHFSLFRRLNQINNKEQQSDATQKALEEAREVNRFFADKDAPRIVQS